MRLLPFLTLLALAGCPGGDDAQDDVDDTSDAGVDGGSDVTGVILGWEARPAIPATNEDTTVVQAMRFGLSNLRLIGDAGTPRVDRTELAWSAGVVPTDDVIESAPAGLYSSLQAMIVAQASTYSFEIQGTYEGTPFVLRDSSSFPLAVTFDGGRNLVAGGTLVIDVRVDVDDMIEDIDFTLLPLQNGTLVLGPGDPQLPALRGEVAAAFEVSDE